MRRRLDGAVQGVEVPALPAPERGPRRRLDGAVQGVEVPALPAPERLLRTVAVLPIRLYQLLISPLVPANTCKFHPSCSEYAVLAIRRHGVWKGAVLAGWRLLRCNPWSHGGVDYP